MKRFLSVLGVALGLTLLSGTAASAETYSPPCEQGNVKCDGESSGDAPVGAWCSFDHDGNPDTPALEGHVDKHGRCVCAVVPTTTSTSTTVPETTTSTTEAPTTTSTTVTPTTVVVSTTVTPSTVIPPTTEVPTVPGPSSTIAVPVDDTIRTDFVASPAAARELPRTGTNTGPMLATGAGLIALGVSLVVVARRRMLA